MSVLNDRIWCQTALLEEIIRQSTDCRYSIVQDTALRLGISWAKETNPLTGDLSADLDPIFSLLSELITRH